MLTRSINLSLPDTNYVFLYTIELLSNEMFNVGSMTMMLTREYNYIVSSYLAVFLNTKCCLCIYVLVHWFQVLKTYRENL